MLFTAKRRRAKQAIEVVIEAVPEVVPEAAEAVRETTVAPATATDPSVDELIARLDALIDFFTYSFDRNDEDLAAARQSADGADWVDGFPQGADEPALTAAAV